MATNSLVISNMVNNVTSGVGTPLTAKSAHVPLKELANNTLTIDLTVTNDLTKLLTVLRAPRSGRRTIRSWG